MRLHKPVNILFAVAAYITTAYWFIASTSFANPVVTLARSMSDIFAGIRLMDVPGFLVAQPAGALAGTLLFGWLVRIDRKDAGAVVLPQAKRKTYESQRTNINFIHREFGSQPNG